MEDQLYQIARGRPPTPGLEVDRRDFMQLVGATALALAGTGCASELPRKIMPYSRSTPNVLPGVTTMYATSMPLDGYAAGLLVASREGRPIKIEGNPDHPATAHGTTLFQQASIWQLYDDS